MSCQQQPLLICSTIVNYGYRGFVSAASTHTLQTCLLMCFHTTRPFIKRWTWDLYVCNDFNVWYMKTRQAGIMISSTSVQSNELKSLILLWLGIKLLPLDLQSNTWANWPQAVSNTKIWLLWYIQTFSMVIKTVSSDCLSQSRLTISSVNSNNFSCLNQHGTPHIRNWEPLI